MIHLILLLIFFFIGYTLFKEIKFYIESFETKYSIFKTMFNKLFLKKNKKFFFIKLTTFHQQFYERNLKNNSFWIFKSI